MPQFLIDSISKNQKIYIICCSKLLTSERAPRGYFSQYIVYDINVQNCDTKAPKAMNIHK